MPETEAAQDRECLKEYGGDVGFSFCAPMIYPSFCVRRCRADKGAKGGECRWGEEFNVKCLCDFCGDKAYDQFLKYWYLINPACIMVCLKIKVKIDPSNNVMS